MRYRIIFFKNLESEPFGCSASEVQADEAGIFFAAEFLSVDPGFSLGFVRDFCGRFPVGVVVSLFLAALMGASAGSELVFLSNNLTTFSDRIDSKQ